MSVIIYQSVIRSRPVTPVVNIPGYVNILVGRDNLTDKCLKKKDGKVTDSQSLIKSVRQRPCLLGIILKTRRFHDDS